MAEGVAMAVPEAMAAAVTQAETAEPVEPVATEVAEAAEVRVDAVELFTFITKQTTTSGPFHTK